jgi:putative hydrolase of the HAD superfamily
MTDVPAPRAIKAIVSDFIGVLTTPIAGVFTQFQQEIGVPPEALRDALQRSAQRTGDNPLFEVECGRITEEEFLKALEHELAEEFGRHVSLRAFTDHYWSSLSHNEEVVGFLRDARSAGYRLALLTNNVREWEPRWRPKWPIDELFETVVDSGFVGLRKPDPAIYELVLSRLDLPPEACVFIDDLEHNVVAARECGLHAVHFRDTGQALADVRAVLETA